ncbi:hypothetical protein ACHAXS_003389 [Conticribra weissflogii]
MPQAALTQNISSCCRAHPTNDQSAKKQKILNSQEDEEPQTIMETFTILLLCCIVMIQYYRPWRINDTL